MMDGLYKISVIIPAYNAEKYLNQCLDSIVAQTIFEEIEVIVINDGSTDNTQKIAEDYKKKYSNFKVYSQENKGLSVTRARGIELAQGEYIGWVDADDFIKPNMYEKLLREGNGADVVICNYAFYPHSVATKAKWFKEYKGSVDWLFLQRNTQPWNKIVKKKLLIDIDMPKWIIRCADGAYFMCLVKANTIVTINDELYVYRVGHVSMSSDYSNLKKFEDNTALAEGLIEYCDAFHLQNTLGEYFNYHKIYTILQRLMVAAFNGNKLSYDNAKKLLWSVNWKSNTLTKEILDHNFGKLKSFIIRHVIPYNYSLSRAICKIGLR